MFRHSLWLPLVALVLFVPAVSARDDDPPAPVEIAHIKMSGDMEEAPGSPETLFGGASENFRAKIDRIKKAKKDAKIKALYLEIDGLGVGFAKLDELTRTLEDFKKSGKKIYGYLESGDAKDYLLATSCDEICLPEAGWLMLVGMRMEMTFYKDLFELVGVQADFLMMGDFKSYAEPYLRSSMSEANKKQMTSLLDDRYLHGMVERIVKNRPAKKWSTEDVTKIIDKGPYTARAAQKLGLIDHVEYEADFKDKIKKALNAKDVKFVKNYGQKKADKIDPSDFFSLMRLLAGPKGGFSSSEPKIAVIYATGSIVSGKSGSSLLGGESCGSTTIIEAIQQAENDKTVKAIVLRVDSPGGSALASDLMWNELVKCKKPLVASMSDVAASGGYYISMAAKKIYADPGTITGSIGVVGGKLVTGGVFDKVGIKTEILSRGTNSGIFSTTTKFSDTEREAFRSMMKDTYDIFLDKAVAGRQKAGKKMTRPELEKLAGGRVWTGRQALENGLIDELGTLDDAVAAAKKMAGIEGDKELELLPLPKTKGLLDSLLDSRSDATMGLDLSKLPLLRQAPELTRKLRAIDGLMQLQKEPAWLVLPFHIEMK